MSTKTLEAPETSLSERKTSLGAFIKRINKAIGNEFVNRIEVGINLKAIEDDELYTQENFGSFKEFIEEIYQKPGLFDYKQARRLINVAERVVAIRAAIPEGSGIPEPTAEAQVRELLAYKPSEAANLYIKFAEQATKAGVPITGPLIKDLRSNIREIESVVTPAKAPEKSWIAPEASTEQTEEAPDSIDFSDIQPKRHSAEAIATMDRIESLEGEGGFPRGSRMEIENQHISISDTDLGDWGRRYEDDETFKKIGRLILSSERVPFTVAYRLINKTLNEETVTKLTLVDFIHLAIAAGGSGAFELRGYRVTAKPIPPK